MESIRPAKKEDVRWEADGFASENPEDFLPQIDPETGEIIE